MNTIALLTGRGNNTLTDKNVLDILGKPVLFYPAHAARAVAQINAWYCSSDDEKILAAAESEGYKRIVRPPEFARPTSRHIECILHALNLFKSEGCLPEICVVLLANNITVDPKWISECIDIMRNDYSVSAVVPVYEDNDHHPLRAKKILADGTISMFEGNPPKNISSNRQDLPPCYFLAHNFWVLRTDVVLSGKNGQPPWEFMGNKIIPYIIHESIDIHEESDLIKARNWIDNHYFDK